MAGADAGCASQPARAGVDVGAVSKGEAFAGVIAALVLIEIGLQCVSSPNLPPLPRIERDGRSRQIGGTDRYSATACVDVGVRTTETP